MKKIVFFITCITILSCNKLEIKTPEASQVDQKELVEKVPKVDVIDGVLIFNSIDDYFDMTSYTQKMRPDQINKWLQSHHFTNLSSKYIQLYDQINKFTTEEEIVRFVNKNAEYLSIEIDGTKEKEVIQRTESYWNFFANSDFLIKIGEQIIDVRHETQYRNVLPVGNGPGIGGQSSLPCGNPTIRYYTHNSSCFSGRRAKLRVGSAVDNIGPPTYAIIHENSIKLNGQRKIACIWVNYDTELGFATSTTPFVISNYQNFVFDDPLVGIYGCSSCYELLLSIDRPSSGSGTPSITSASAKGTTRGIGSNWVTVNCQ